MVRRFIYRFPIPPRNVFEKRRDAFRFRREFDPFIIWSERLVYGCGTITRVRKVGGRLVAICI